MQTQENTKLRRAIRQGLAAAALVPACLVAQEAAAQVATAPTANAGLDQTIADTNLYEGEVVQLAGTGATTNAQGGPLQYIWTEGQNVVAYGATPTVFLDDGVHTLTLSVTDLCCSSQGSLTTTDTVTITVQPAGALTPNKLSMWQGLQAVCNRVYDGGEGGGDFTNEEKVVPRDPDPEDQADLSDRCENFTARALDQMGAYEFNSLRTQMLVFSQTQFHGVQDRLSALRGGNPDGKLAGVTPAYGGGAAGDGKSKLGYWMRGNGGSGEKDATAADPGFESDQWGLTGGLDYRLGDNAVMGLSFGYGNVDLTFGGGELDLDRGGVDATGFSGAFYASSYFGGFYVDGVVSYSQLDFETERHILYAEGSFPFTTIDRVAEGETDGSTLAASVSFGYELSKGGFTFAPSLGYTYQDAGVDAFNEFGGGGLDLYFNEQEYKSSTANAEVRMSYVWNTAWGVILPHLRTTYVKEFENGTSALGVRFVNDPIANTDPPPDISVISDEIDESYLRISAGVSAQFKNGVAAYVEYQRLAGYQDTDFQDLTFGLRFHVGF
jgi:outer membrane lipase/esterase